MSSEVEDSEWVGRPDHPLLNDLIMGSVFEHLGKKELKECRLVCKRWNVLTIPFTRKAFLVTILHIKNTTIKHTMKEFVNVFRSNVFGVPFARFQLGSFCATDVVDQEFIKLCGETTKEIGFLREILTVEDVSELLKSTPKLEIFQIPWSLQSRSGNIRNIVKLFPDGLENSKSGLTSLKTLIVPRVNPKHQKNKCCPTFLDELITAAQNISCLDMSGSDSRISFDVLSLIVKLGRESFIQELKISVKQGYYRDYVDLLLRMTVKPNGLRLKRFHYEAQYSDQDNLALQLIPHFKVTLEYLRLDLHERQCPSFEEFPKMSRLKSMSLAWFPEDFKYRFVNLSEIFPVLRELRLWGMSIQANDEFFPDSEPCPNMKTLRLDSNSGMTINGFNQMLTLFPNLTKLKINVQVDGAEILRQIWSQMTQLKSLEINGDLQTKADSLDSVLTGISTHGLQEMGTVVRNLERMANGVERQEMILRLRTQHSTLPSITNLTSLSSLTMRLTGEGGRLCRGDFLTDLSVYFCFYSMSRLKELNVENCKFTKTCCGILRKDMGLETSAFTNSRFKDIISSVAWRRIEFFP